MNRPVGGAGIVLDKVGMRFGGDNPVVALEDIDLEIPPVSSSRLSAHRVAASRPCCVSFRACSNPRPEPSRFTARRLNRPDAMSNSGSSSRTPCCSRGYGPWATSCCPAGSSAHATRHSSRTEQLARRLLREVGLGGFEEHYPAQMSGGMQSRVALARALIYQASTLLMDEPFGALDEFTRDRLNLQLLDVWHKAQATVIFVTHSIQEAIFLADRVAVLSPRPGRIVRIARVPFPRPRPLDLRFEPEFGSLARELRALLETDTTMGAA